MSSAPAADQIWQDARWLGQAVDPGAGLIRLVEMTPADYRDASFLDDRMFEQPRNAHVVPWAEIADGMPKHARSDARWIFHIGHVGSTLIARLLGELDDVLSIREPRALRDLTASPREAREPFIPGVQALLSRSFAPGERALVKATSMVSEIAAELVPAGERALFLYTEPQSYIAGILAGENSRKELAGLADMRRHRLGSRKIHLQAARHEADLAAAAWACEMTALESAADAMQNREVLWSDFDRMLVTMETSLADAARLFEFEARIDRLREIVSGPLMRRYSKAQEYDYSPDLRRELLAEARDRHGPQVSSAIAMLERAAQQSPLLARALSRSNLEI